MAHDPNQMSARANPEPVMVQLDSKTKKLKSNESFAMRDLSSSSSEPLTAQPVEDINEEDEERQGLKLGLGDFVFYSVLVGRASLSDWVVTVGSILAVLSGLVLTILILVLKRKPLPALPISIFLGITVFLVGTLTLVPMIESLIIFNNPGSVLRAGVASPQLIYL